MVDSPRTARIPERPASHHIQMFCCAIVFTLFPFYALAIDESLSERRQLCDLSALENAVDHYLQIASEGGWPHIPSGPALKEGDRNVRVSLLKKRLIASGDLEPSELPEQPDAVNGMLKEAVPGSQTRRDPIVNGLASNQNERLPLPKQSLPTRTDLAEPANQNDVFDGMLKEAVQRFQTRHGLTDNGIVGVETIKELNVTTSDRIKQLASTIEYCKKMPPLQENRYILINITDFTLNLIEDGKPVLNMPVIVGKTTNQTPEFNGLITNVIINPAWSVPYSIASKELLPKLKKNPGYLSRSRMQVYRSNQRIDPSAINWASYSTKNFPLLLRQDPGPGNSLGRIKFMFTNPHDIYLHDTPTKKLFQKFPRAFSHGCIRVQAPVDLAVYLMQDTPMGSEEAIKSAISKGKTRSLTLPSPIPINIVYVTAWVDSEGIVQFRPNIYNRKLSDAGEIVTKNNAAAKTTDTAKTDHKKEAAELAEAHPPTEAAVKTTPPAKITSVATASGQSKALIKTTEATTAAVQPAAPIKAPAAAPAPAHTKTLIKTPAEAKTAVQTAHTPKAPAAALPVIQAKPVAQTPVAAKSAVHATASPKAPAAAPPVVQAKPVAKTPMSEKSAVQTTAPAKAPAAAPPVIQAKPVAQTPAAAKSSVQTTAPVKTPVATQAAAQAVTLARTSPVSPAPAQKVKVIGNRDSKRYHLPGMKYYNAVEAYHRVEFDSEADAIKAGYYKARR